MVDAEPWVLLSVGTAFVVLRLYARVSKVGFRELELDDYLMIVFVVSRSQDLALFPYRHAKENLIDLTRVWGAGS